MLSFNKDHIVWRVGLDLDGVIIDHTKNKIRVARQFGIELSPQDIPSDIMGLKMDPTIYKAIQKIIYDDPEVAFTAPLVVGAENGLSRMKAARLPMYLISRRPAASTTDKLLDIHGLRKRYFNQGNVFFVKEKPDKNIVARKLFLDVYLDDEPSVLEVMPSVPHRFLLDSLNVYPEDPNYTKVSSWAEFVDKLQTL